MSTPPVAPPEVVEVACRGFYSAAGVHWDTLSAYDQEQAVACMTEALRAVGEWSLARRGEQLTLGNDETDQGPG